MNMDTFSQVIDRISETAEVVKLHWVGEPLLHPRLLEMIRYARRNISGLLFFSTNATLLRGTLAEAIRVSGLDKIVLSLDGMSAASYEAVRKKGSFEEVFTNIETFVTSVDERGGPLCEIQMIVTDFNKHEIDAFKRKWASFKNTAVNVTWLTDWAGNIPDRHLISEARNPGHASPRQCACTCGSKCKLLGTVMLICAASMYGVRFSLEIYATLHSRAFGRAELSPDFGGNICKIDSPESALHAQTGLSPKSTNSGIP